MYKLKTEEVLEKFQTTTKGLTSEEAAIRLERYGPNALEEKPKKSFLKRLWDSINDPMVLILIVAAIISGIMGEKIDTIIILAVVAINTLIELIQESKAEEAVEALKKMSAQEAHVLRDGTVRVIDAALLVPGDIVVLHTGDLIPADLRLVSSSSLKIEEASLTGESVPSDKDASFITTEDVPLGDRKNLAFYGTGVTYGRGQGLVIGTGMKTEMGKIADMISEESDTKTPLQKKLDELGKYLTIGILLICVVIFATIIIKAGSMDAENIFEALMISISLAVAAIPEGMPAIVTIVMAMGVTRMAKEKAIIKKLPSVETLGSTDVICSDKTGTLTQNIMDVREVFYNDTVFSANEFLTEDNVSVLFDIIYLSNDSEITENGEEIGDPTETSLIRFALEKYGRDFFETKYRVDDLPFDSERKMMSTVNQVEEKHFVFTKGAPDVVLQKSTHYYQNDKIIPMTGEKKAQIMKANKQMGDKALRVLAGAYKPFKKEEELEENLVFVGLVGMMDPPRPEAYDAIQKCKQAGITTVMITGDHLDTAVAIAKELDILEEGTKAIFGSEIDALTDEDLVDFVQDVRIFARVSPEHKVRIVKAWQASGKVVAMTGDGVNDAPALKVADIGVGMGITGTDVSKGVSDMLLSDDNFATIVNAVEEGRKIFMNIRKSIQFLLSSNFSEVMSIFIATLFLPANTQLLNPIHILWINLVTDTLPAIGLGMNKSKGNVMNDPPRDASKSIFADGVGINVVLQGTIMSIITLTAYWFGAQTSPILGSTMAFMALSTVQLFHSFNIKVGKDSLFSKETFDNRLMNIGFIVPFALLLLIENIPFLNEVFHVVPLTWREWVVVIGLAALILPLDEIKRAIIRQRDKKRKIAA